MPKYLVKVMREEEIEVEADNDGDAEDTVAHMYTNDPRTKICIITSRIASVKATHIYNWDKIPVSLEVVRQRRLAALGHE